MPQCTVTPPRNLLCCTQTSSDEYPPPIAPKPVRFPRIAIKSKPTGNEVVVRETEKVVEEKVIQQRTEEVPGGGLRTVEYVEKIIETEVSEPIEWRLPHPSTYILTPRCARTYFGCTFS